MQCKSCISVGDFAESQAMQEFLGMSRPPEEMVRVFAMVSKGDHSELVGLTTEELLEFTGETQPKWAPTTPGVMKAEVEDKPEKVLDFDLMEEDGPSKPTFLLKDLEAEVNELGKVEARGDMTDHVRAELPKIRSSLLVLPDLIRSVLDLILENKEHGESVTLELMKRLQHNLSTPFALIGDLSAKEEALQGYGNNISSVLAGLSRSVSEIQDAVGIEPGSERPPK